MDEEITPTKDIDGSQGDKTENIEDGNNANSNGDAESNAENMIGDEVNEDVVKDKDDADKDGNNNEPIGDLNSEGQSADGTEKESIRGEGEGTEEIEVEKQEHEETDPTERPASAPTPSNKEDEQQESERESPEGKEEEREEIPKAPGSPTGTASTLKVKSPVRKHTTTPADDSGLVQPALPAIPRGQAKVQQIASSISDARKKGVTGPPTVYPIRSRVPPKLVRLATVTVSPAKTRPAPHGPSLYYEEPKRPQKVITWDQAHNARPPLRIDMEGPGPCSYSPLNKPLYETNAPSFSFGTKCFPEKPAGVGSRTSWAKSWFQSNHPYHHKADYVREGLWPSPTHYPKPKALGARQRTMYEAPSYTFGHKTEFSIVKAGAHKEPSPTDYERQNADGQVLRRGPSFSHQFRREGTVLWGCTESNPGPAAYTPAIKQKQQKPSYTIQGIRRSKSHILGPYSTM